MNLPETLMACRARPGAMDSEISALEQSLGHRLPSDYRVFLQESDGAEGFVAPGVYLVLWSVNDIDRLNNAYAVGEFLPGVVLLGTDGSDTGYGFVATSRDTEYISVPLIGMGPEEATHLGNSLEGFIERLRHGTEYLKS